MAHEPIFFSHRSADACIGVHSKLLIVDDLIVTIGSANCSNRSMGLDTECNLVIAGTQNKTIQAALKRVRHRLLAEHLGLHVSEVQQTERRKRSIISTINYLNNGARRLDEYLCDEEDEIERLLASTTLIDPERPVQPDQLWRILDRQSQPGDVRRHVAIMLLSLAFVGGLWLLWRWLCRERV